MIALGDLICLGRSLHPQRWPSKWWQYMCMVILNPFGTPNIIWAGHRIPMIFLSGVEVVFFVFERGSRKMGAPQIIYGDLGIRSGLGLVPQLCMVLGPFMWPACLETVVPLARKVQAMVCQALYNSIPKYPRLGIDFLKNQNLWCHFLRGWTWMNIQPLFLCSPELFGCSPQGAGVLTHTHLASLELIWKPHGFDWNDEIDYMARHGPKRVSILNFRSCPYGRIASHGWPDLFGKNYRTTDCSWFFGSVRSEFQQACAQSVWVVGDFEFPLAIPVRSVDPSLWRIFSWFVVTQTDKRSLTSIQTVNWIFVALHPWWKESTSNLSIYHRLLGLRSWLAP